MILFPETTNQLAQKTTLDLDKKSGEKEKTKKVLGDEEEGWDHRETGLERLATRRQFKNIDFASAATIQEARHSFLAS